MGVDRAVIAVLLSMLFAGCSGSPSQRACVGFVLLEQERRLSACVLAADLLLTAAHGPNPYPRTGYAATLAPEADPHFVKFTVEMSGMTEPIAGGRSDRTIATFDEFVAEAIEHRHDWILLRVAPPLQDAPTAWALGDPLPGDMARILRFVANDDRQLIVGGAIESLEGKVLSIAHPAWPDELFLTRLDESPSDKRPGPGSSGAPVFIRRESSNAWELAGIHLGSFVADVDGRRTVVAVARRLPRAEIVRALD